MCQPDILTNASLSLRYAARPGMRRKESILWFAGAVRLKSHTLLRMAVDVILAVAGGTRLFAQGRIRAAFRVRKGQLPRKAPLA